MLFNSLSFAVFLPIVYLLYLALKHRWQNRMLLMASYIFYGFWDWRFLSLLWVSTLLDFTCGIQIRDSQDERIRRFFLGLSLCGNLFLLCFFKYFNWFIDNLRLLFDGIHLPFPDQVMHVILPIGISFYTFQTMSYSIDVYRKKMEPCRNIIDFALFISYFPQLVAGPIERAVRLLPQIQKPRTINRTQFAEGCHFIFWGLFLKVFIADNLARIVDPVFMAPPPYNGAAVLMAVYAFAFQIYGDFAGYSFIAIGVARLMGITLMDNFDRPYYTPDISVFWRQWHISLSSWFRDYVFSPFYMWIERHPRLSQMTLQQRHQLSFFIALIVAEVMLGFWHGAGWNFGLFGLYHGLMIWLFYSTKNTYNRMPIPLRMVVNFHIVGLGWLIFRATSLPQIAHMLEGLIFRFDLSAYPQFWTMGFTLVFYIWILMAVEAYQHTQNDLYAILKPHPVFKTLFYCVCFLLLVTFGVRESREFIYFEF